MKKISIMITLLLSSVWIGCNSTPGTRAGSTGTVSLSLEMEAPAGGADHYTSQNGYEITLQTLAMSFSQISMGGEELETDFSASFADEEQVDVVEVEDVPAGDYDTVELTLHPSEDATSPLPEKSVLMIGTATSGSNTCTLRVEIVSSSEITIDLGDTPFDMSANSEEELLVVFDPAQVFSTIDIPAACTGDATVTISATSHADLATTILGQIRTGDVLSVESTEGHTHEH